MYKVIFDLITDPLGLPIPALYEYMIMFAIGIIAYVLAYRLTGRFMSNGDIGRGEEASLVHWIIRIVIYILLWALTRIGIVVYRFVVDNVVVSIISVVCVVALVVTIIVSREFERKHE